ncbi:MAG TPA: tetratricopeptide repeat protein [Blastocatellia bacterium]|nr:tetratricopeptide repeat protein [Blastocatellia bacterium]
MRSKLKLLLKLFYNPAQAMTEIGASAPYLVGAVLAIAATTVYREALNHELWRTLQNINRSPSRPGMFAPFVKFIGGGILSSASPLFFLIVVFVPACLLAASLIEKRASFSVLLRQEYAPLVSCALYGWAAAHLMMLIPALVIYQPGPNRQAAEEALRLAPLPYFVFLITITLRAVLHMAYGRAIGVVALASLSLVALPFLTGMLLPLLTSPFLLILVILLLRNFLGDAISAQRSREDFKRNLEASTLNPADASAHYNLGLIYQQRGQSEEAKASFIRAIEIDPDETDAHYQLGRIAREQGRLAEAINYFDAVVRRNPDHSQSEVWREIGRAYSQAGQHADARAAFERFLEKRPSDAEGHYRYGLTLHNLGRSDEAAREMRSCIESAKTSPAYKYRAEKHWMNEAESFLRSQAMGQKAESSRQ